LIHPGFSHPSIVQPFVAINRRVGPALLASLASHAAMIAVLLVVLRSGPPPRRPSASPPDVTIARLVWLNEPGPGGGGGGGGNRMNEPPRRAELPGRDAITVPASRPPNLETPRPTTRDQEPPPPMLNIPVVTLAASTESLPGAIDAPPGSPTLSQGPGTDGGSGTGTGSGDGPGRGPGLGNGQNGGVGGDVYRPGNDVTMPIEIHKGAPQYTTDAMRARVQGSIVVECVVQTNGACTNIRVTRSFDPAFGLDREAIKAAAQWQFRPGTRRGEPVPVLVSMEIAFALR
jgi:protein TonB